MNITDLFLTMIEIGTDKNGFCANTANIWQIVGYFLLAFKIVIPILLILFGMIDLGKAVVASKDDEIKKATKGLVMRAIAAVIVFLIPTVVTFIMGLVSNFTSSGAAEDFEVCKACISNPSSKNNACQQYVDKAWGTGSKTSGEVEE